jgi:hypothetical protein
MNKGEAMTKDEIANLRANLAELGAGLSQATEDVDQITHLVSRGAKAEAIDRLSQLRDALDFAAAACTKAAEEPIADTNKAPTP